jgi:hypothetical protein
MVSLSPDACAPSVFAINQLRRGRHGKIPMPNRLFGSIRRECVDHIVVFGEQHLRHALLNESWLGLLFSDPRPRRLGPAHECR